LLKGETELDDGAVSELDRKENEGQVEDPRSEGVRREEGRTGIWTSA
jgi:hypothetical protein